MNHCLTRRVDDLERQVNAHESKPRIVVMRPGETAEEALARCPWAMILVPGKEPLLT
jgi:hypothetical protein